MKETILSILGTILFFVIIIAMLKFAFSPEVMCAGEHMKGCDGTNNCGCYEKLIEAERN